MYNNKFDTFAYSPSVPPLTPAARAKIVAALCERANKRKEKIIAAKKATHLKWNEELLELKKQPPRKLTVPELISLPSRHVPATCISTNLEHTSAETDIIESNTVSEQTQAINNYANVVESMVDEKESSESVQRPVLFDVGSMLEKQKQTVEQYDEIEDHTSNSITAEYDNELYNTEFGTEILDQSLIAFENHHGTLNNDDVVVDGDVDSTSTVLESNSETSDDASSVIFESNDQVESSVEQILVNEIKTEEDVEDRVARPMLIDIAKLWTIVTNRAKEDIKKLKGDDASLTGAGGIAGALVAMITMKK